MFCARHFFGSQVFKTTSNVLNPDVPVNIVNIAFIDCLLPLAVTKLAHWPMPSLIRQNTRYQNPEKAKTNDNYRPASNPHESKGGEIRDTKTFNVSHNIVSWLVLACFAFFTLSRNKNVSCGLKKVVVKSRVRVYSEL